MGVDEIELRLKNLINVGERSQVYAPDEVLESGLLKEAIAKAKTMARWDERLTVGRLTKRIAAAWAWPWPSKGPA